LENLDNQGDKKKSMKKIISDTIRLFGIAALIALPILTACATVEPGTVDDPGKALDAPTEPEAFDESYSEGQQYPEEQDNQ
jgi:hypothetical protein